MMIKVLEKLALPTSIPSSSVVVDKVGGAEVEIEVEVFLEVVIEEEEEAAPIQLV